MSNIKSKAAEKATKVVNEFLNNRTEKNWANLQELFWFGLRKFALGYVRTFDDADDIVIRTFVRAYEHIDEYEPEVAAFSTWLWTICKNECLTMLAEKRKMPTVEADIADYCALTTPSVLVNNVQDDIFETSDEELKMLSPEDVITRIYNATVHEINSLPDTARTVITMKLIDNKKIKDISVALNMNESTVKNYLYDAKRKLDTCMKTKYKHLYSLYVDCNNAKACSSF